MTEVSRRQFDFPKIGLPKVAVDGAGSHLSKLLPPAWTSRVRASTTHSTALLQDIWRMTPVTADTSHLKPTRSRWHRALLGSLAPFAGGILLLAVGCASRETFISPNHLSSELQPPSVERAEDTEPDAETASESSIRLTSGSADEEPSRLTPAYSSPRRFVVVSGEVRKPGEFMFPEGRDFRVLEAVARAEGIPNKVVDTVIVCRKQKGCDDRALILVSLRKATRSETENIRLMPGDIVSVEPNLTTLLKDSSAYVGAAAMGGGMMLIGGPN